ncbi:hypothetical protein SpAn4DRAFT_0592 [Sporomusa ovata]|uniref:Uncharacterized protein n=1 Tax=Sporomusa ovata TaxID=2378 RepID=A0A0U1L396_9FIRM|nr:hypothetical protein SpAn4DRAFT_0592 [Sporomusa ovata]
MVTDSNAYYRTGCIKKVALPGVTAGQMGWVTDSRRFPISMSLYLERG